MVKERDKMSKIDDAEKIIEVLDEYNKIISSNKTELIVDFVEKNLKILSDKESANFIINSINYFTNKKKVKTSIYSYLFSLFANRIFDENSDDKYFSLNLNMVLRLISEANENLKAEREISKGYKYVIDKYALDKLQNTQWHKYPEDKPKENGNYLITTIYGHIPEVISESYENGEFNLDAFVVAWAEKPMPYNEDESI